jgi:predicted amidohydrolase YtcJ
MKRKKAFINGKIYTVNKNNLFAEAVIIRGNKIYFVGSNEKAKNLIDSETEIIDLKKKLMLPGFIDNHVHFVDGGLFLTGLNLQNAKSIEEFTASLKYYISKHKRDWITGGNWNNENWNNVSLPSKYDIDPFSKDIPIFIERMDKHMALANSAALSIAGISKNTPSPPGGEIVKDKISGEPTGILKDSAMTLVYKVIPQPSDAKIKKATIMALNEAMKNGVTGVHDISLPEHVSVYQKLSDGGKLSCRIYSRLPINNYKDFLQKFNASDIQNERLKLGSLKAFADGSLGTRTAWFFDQYENEKNNFGMPTEIVFNGSLEKLSLEADLNKLQISVHAIGDRANSFVLDIFEKIVNTNPFWDRRFRIEHAQHVRSVDIKRFAELGVIASAQPFHLYDDGNWAEREIGSRIKEAFSFNSFLKENVKLCFGSDWPVAPLNPVLGIYAAVTRNTSNNKNLNGWIPEQKISVVDAVKCFTINCAYASFDENLLGSIEQGKMADFAILSHDIFSIAPEDIKYVNVDMTVFDGEIIFER